MSGAEYVPDVTNPAHSVDRPTVLRSARGSALFSPIRDRRPVFATRELAPERKAGMIDFSDEKREEILRFIDSLDGCCVQRSYLGYR
ncbi:MAG TPA: hypothetical protein VLG72_05040 [Nitrospirota bacterium]|nr:hypothetical protein [Nitrospirota bacterium]